MSTETKKTKTPRLRFPEFREAGEWDIKPLGKVAENLDNKRIPISESERVKGMIPYYGASGIIDYVKHFIFDETLLCISEDGANLVARTYPIAFSITGKTWVNNHAHVLKFKNNSTQILVENYLNSISLEDFLTGMAQPKLNRAKLDIIPIPLPKPDEQQKTAATLSSLDDLIAAQSEKIKALQAHKKGLMQRLFPAEGEMAPRLRFGEFEGEWKNKNLKPFLEEYSERVSANTDLPIFSSTRTGLVSQKDYYSGRELLNEGEYGVVPKGYFVYRHMSDDTTFKFNINVNYDKIAVSREYPVFKTINLNSHFLLYKLNEGYDFPKFAAEQRKGGTRTRLYFKTLCTWSTLIPSPDEQQKIATALSSLDDLIAAQSQKLEALKAHKKGLMQQLFPNPNEP